MYYKNWGGRHAPPPPPPKKEKVVSHSSVNVNGMTVEIIGKKVYVNGSRVREDNTYKRRTVTTALLAFAIGGLVGLVPSALHLVNAGVL